MLSLRLSISFEEAVTLSSIVLRTNNPCLPAGREVKKFSDCLRYAKMELMRDPSLSVVFLPFQTHKEYKKNLESLCLVCN